MPTVEDILAGFPEFATPPGDQAMWVDLADKRVADLPAWGNDEDLRNLAVAYKAAEMMGASGVVSVPSGAPISSESIGDASVSYAVAAPAVESSSTTKYGRLFDELVAENFVPAMTSYA